MHPDSSTLERSPAEGRSPASDSAERRKMIRKLAEQGILDPDEALRCTAVYQKGAQATELLNGDTTDLSPQQIRQARADRAAGDKAATALLGSMIRLNIRIVREFAESRYGRQGAEQQMDELLAEANITVLEAARNFDPTRGPSFSTWAAQAVRNKIRNLVMDTSLSGMKVSSSWNRMRRRARLERSDMTAELGRPPTTDELRERLEQVCYRWAMDHLTPGQRAQPEAKQREYATVKLRRQGMLAALNHLDEVLAAGFEVQSLQAPLGSEGESTLEGVLEGRSTGPDAFEHVSHQEMATSIRAAINKLGERDKTVILYRFGFVDGTSWTYQDIADMFSISAERVRQIEGRVRASMQKDPEYGPVLRAHLKPEG